MYNSANIARVRADEAAAAAREAAEEQRTQEEDATRRLMILRGETPPPLVSAPLAAGEAAARRPDGLGRERKRKRKERGEDDTESEMRVARERIEAGPDSSTTDRGAPVAKDAVTVPLVDPTGHIDLFGTGPLPAEREKPKKPGGDEAAFALRFADAAGRGKPSLLGGGGQWYAAGEGREASGAPHTDVWGNDDPGRKAREARRIDRADPLALMKSGARRVRELECERRRERDERERELKELKREERRRRRQRRKRDETSRPRAMEDDDGGGSGYDSLEGFSLDAAAPRRSGGRRGRGRQTDGAGGSPLTTREEARADMAAVGETRTADGTATATALGRRGSCYIPTEQRQ